MVRDGSQGPRRGRRTTGVMLAGRGWAKVSRLGGRDAVQGRRDVDGDPLGLVARRHSARVAGRVTTRSARGGAVGAKAVQLSVGR